MIIALIANPASCGRAAASRMPGIEQALSDRGIAFDRFDSAYPGHVVDIAAGLNIPGYDAIVCAGGDGTNFQLINGLLSACQPDRLPPIGIIPVGSGNSFARDLNLFTPADAVAAIHRQQSRSVDVLSFSQDTGPVYFVNLAGLGFVTDVAHTARYFKKLGALSYLIGVFYRTLFLKFHEINLVIDGTRISGSNCFVEFCNSRFTGGNMCMAPQAQLDDGLMDVIIADPLSRVSLLKTFPKIFSGQHIHVPGIHMFKARQCRIETRPVKWMLPDGELFGRTPAQIDVHPRLLRYLV